MDPTTNSSSGSASTLRGYVLLPSLTETLTESTSNLLTQSLLMSVATALLTLRPPSTSTYVTQTQRPSSISNSSSSCTMSLLSRVVEVASETSPSL